MAQKGLSLEEHLKTVNSLPTERELENAFANANFREEDLACIKYKDLPSNKAVEKYRLGIVSYAMLKFACGYKNGYTSQMILEKLGLVIKRGLTLRGKYCLWEWFKPDSKQS